MRNTTMLKAVLMRFTIKLDRSDDGQWAMLLMDKYGDGGKEIYATKYSDLVRKAYAHLKRVVKED